MKNLTPLLLILCLACAEPNGPEPTPSPSSEPIHALNEFGKALLEIEQLTNELEFISRAARTGEPKLFIGCASVSTSTDGDFTIYTIDFNHTQCIDGKVRDGDMQIAVNGETQDVIIQSFELLIDDSKVQGTYTFHPVVEEGIDYIKMLSTAARITRGDDWHSFTTTKYYRWKEGEHTTNVNDDVLEIASGEYFFNLKNSGICQLEIETPLLVSYTCTQRNLLPVSGTVAVDALSEITHVNFGNGQCTGSPTQE
jgi:hypothetical protein